MYAKRWDFKPTPAQNDVEKLANDLNISWQNATLLVQRGIKSFDEAKHFFRPNLSQLHNPFLMKDMEQAVNRISAAMENGEKIMVYGDYDVDGTTSVALVYEFLSQHYKNIITYIPDRYNEGYGISLQGIDVAQQENCQLIIALDCGVKALKQVEYANEKNIDFIICDHHRPGHQLPKAFAILDPKREDCNYPYKELSGCGIGFKLMQALSEKHNWPLKNLYQVLDLAAISIACDIVPITGENRILAFFGLQLLNNPEYSRQGVKALLKAANKQGPVDVNTLVFVIGPRINAAGRIEHGLNAVELLTATHPETVKQYAEQIGKNNADRKEKDQEITEAAVRLIETNHELVHASSTVVYNSDWHKGVIGIVASRLIEKYYRPTIVLTESNGKAAGSARSVPGFDVYNAIEACSEHLIQFGGHMYAAGLTIEISKIPDFTKAFDEFVKTNITPEQKTPVEEVDLEIELSDINQKFFNIIQQMSPFGPQNLTPIFCARNVVDAGYTKKVGENADHLKMHIRQIHNPRLDFSGIAFKMAHWYDYIKANNPVDILFSVEQNVWNNQVSLQLMIKDIKESIVKL